MRAHRSIGLRYFLAAQLQSRGHAPSLGQQSGSSVPASAVSANIDKQVGNAVASPAPFKTDIVNFAYDAPQVHLDWQAF